MAPPPSQSCSVPGCDYTTPENIPTWEMLTTHLNTHTQAVHPAPAQHDPAPAAKASKTAKKNRPSITNQMSEETWRFFLDEWNRYKRQTGIKDQELLDELWSCMTDELRQLAFSELTSTGDIWQSNEGSLVHHTLLPYCPPRVETRS